MNTLAPTTPTKSSAPLYQFLEPGDIIRATDECISDDFRSWDAVTGIFIGMPYMPSMKPVRRLVGGSDAGDAATRSSVSDDAIARSKRILELVDTYAEEQTSANRTALRGALMDEFSLLLAAGEPWMVARAHSECGPVVTLFGYFRKNGKRWDQLKGLPNPETLRTGWVPFFAPQPVLPEND